VGLQVLSGKNTNSLFHQENNQGWDEAIGISPSVVYPVVAPWTLVWPEVDWYLLDVKRKEKGKGDLLSAFEY